MQFSSRLMVTMAMLGVAIANPQHPSHPPVAGQKDGRPPQDNSQGKLPEADAIGEVYTSSFTYNEECTGPTMACGPNWNNDPSNKAGTLEPGLDNINIGIAAVNTWLFFNNWNGPNANLNKGWGGGCGQCWELTPREEFNYHNMQPAKDLLPVGKPITVVVTDICTDGGTGNQQPGQLNSNFGQEVHFDICKANNKVWKTFFGNGRNGDGNYPGQVLGSAKRVACPAQVPTFGSTCTAGAKLAKPENCPADGPVAPDPFTGAPKSSVSSTSPTSSPTSERTNSPKAAPPPAPNVIKHYNLDAGDSAGASPSPSPSPFFVQLNDADNGDECEL